MIWIIVWEIFVIVIMTYLLSFIEKRAALRGTGGQETLSPNVQRLIRLSMLLLLLWPILTAFPFLVFIFLAYLPFFLDLSELHCGRPSNWSKNWIIWKWIKSYFRLQLIKTVELNPKQSYIFGLHPHGILPFGGMVNMITETNNISKLLPGVQFRSLAASICFYVPAYRDLLLAGGVCDASRYSAQRILSNKMSILVVPGGATEALYTVNDKDVLYLKKRKGFIRLAIQNGAHLVPVFSFNEASTYNQLSLEIPAVKWAKTKFQRIFGMSLPLITNIIPKRVPIVTVIGKPIPVTKIENPSDEEVVKILDLYIKGVEDLYNEYGPKFNVPTTKKLEII